MTLAFLFALWQARRAHATRRGSGFAFGVGLFGAGVSWVYIALETFGGMPAPLALVGTAGFCAFLSLYPALAGWIVVALDGARQSSRACSPRPARSTLAEWLRGYRASPAFPGSRVGYAQLPGAAAARRLRADRRRVPGVARRRARARRCSRYAIDAIERAVAGASSSHARSSPRWSSRERRDARAHRVDVGRPARRSPVSLVQGNVAQDAQVRSGVSRRRRSSSTPSSSRRATGRLVVLPESAFPMFADEVPERGRRGARAASRRARGDAAGRPVRRRAAASRASDEPRDLQQRGVGRRGDAAALSQAPSGAVRRDDPAQAARRLVHRATCSRSRSRDQARGPDEQPPFEVAGERSPSTSATRMRSATSSARRPRDATLLVNVTNDAWYGRSIAARQHNQIAAMRALETGRPMLRATNTGITSAIAHDGRVIAAAAVVHARRPGSRDRRTHGETPYLALRRCAGSRSLRGCRPSRRRDRIGWRDSR